MDELIDFAELKAAGLLPSPSAETLELLRMDQGDSALVNAIARRPDLEQALLMLGGDAVADALAALGSGALRQLAIGMDLCEHYRRGACQDFDYARFWSRNVAVACAAQALAVEMPVASGGELFCYGLLADIGQLALATTRPRSYARLLRENADGDAAKLLRRESVLYGYSHLSLGAALLRSWHMGHTYSDAVLCKDAPQMAAERNTRHLARVLQLAGCMADLFLAPPSGRKAMIERLAAASQRLQLHTGSLLDTVDEANANWRRWCGALDLPLGGDTILPVAAAPAPAMAGMAA